MAQKDSAPIDVDFSSFLYRERRLLTRGRLPRGPGPGPSTDERSASRGGEDANSLYGAERRRDSGAAPVEMIKSEKGRGAL